MTRTFFALLILIGSTAVLCAQGKPVVLPPNNEESQLFRGLLHFRKIEPESVANIRRGYDYRNLIVVVVGDPGEGRIAEICRTALGSGGAVLISSKFVTNLSSYYPSPNAISIPGNEVGYRTATPDGGVEGFKIDNAFAPEQPNALDRRLMGGPLGNLASEMQLTEGIESIRVFDPSYIQSERLPKELKRLLFRHSPESLVNEGARLVKVGVKTRSFAYAGAGESNNPFRTVLLASSNIFTNRMLYTSGHEVNPTDNLKFADRTVQWLQDGAGTPRTKCLFVENGRIIEKFDDFEFSSIPIGPEIPSPPIPSIDPFDPELQKMLVDKGNSLIDEAQRNNVFNKALTGEPDKKAIVYRLLGVLIGLVLFALLIVKPLFARFGPAFRPIPKNPNLLGPDVELGSVAHRKMELLKTANYGPVVRGYIRELFAERGLPKDFAGDTLPALEFAVPKPDYLRKALATLWAEQARIKPLSYARWTELEPLLASVRAAANDDAWRFSPPEDRESA